MYNMKPTSGPKKPKPKPPVIKTVKPKPRKGM